MAAMTIFKGIIYVNSVVDIGQPRYIARSYLDTWIKA